MPKHLVKFMYTDPLLFYTLYMHLSVNINNYSLMQLIILQPVAIRSIVLSINMPCLASNLLPLPFQPGTCIYYVLHKFLMLNMHLFFFAVCLRLQVNPQNKNQFYGISPERGFADFIFAHIILHIVVMNFIG